MAAILLVVGDAGAPSAMDLAWQGLLEDVGHTVTLRSDETAAGSPPATGFDGLVVSESVSAGTLGTKYAGVQVPFVCHEADGNIANNGFDLGSNSNTFTDNDVAIQAPAHEIADGPHGTFSGTVVIFTAASPQGWLTGLGAGGVNVAARPANTAEVVLGAYESGATRADGNPSPARCVFLGIRNNATNLLNPDGENLVKNAYEWAFGAVGGEAHEGTMSVSGGGDMSAAGEAEAPGVSGSVSVAGGGGLATSGRKDALGGSVIAVAGSFVASGERTVGAGLAVTGGGQTAATGRKDAQGAATTTTGGGAVAGGAKAALVVLSVAGGGTFAATGEGEGSPSAVGQVVFSGGGGLAALGHKQTGGVASVTATGTVVAVGARHSFGTVAVSATGTFTAAGTTGVVVAAPELGLPLRAVALDTPSHAKPLDVPSRAAPL